MFDRDLINGLPKHERESIEIALAALSNSPIFDLQEQRLLAILASGSETEAEEDSLRRLRKYRADRSRLLSLKQLGVDINEERSDD